MVITRSDCGVAASPSRLIRDVSRLKQRRLRVYRAAFPANSPKQADFPHVYLCCSAEPVHRHRHTHLHSHTETFCPSLSLPPSHKHWIIEVKGQINLFLSAEASSPEKHRCVISSLPDFICGDTCSTTSVLAYDTRKQKASKKALASKRLTLKMNMTRRESVPLICTISKEYCCVVLASLWRSPPTCSTSSTLQGSVLLKVKIIKTTIRDHQRTPDLLIPSVWNVLHWEYRHRKIPFPGFSLN